MNLQNKKESEDNNVGLTTDDGLEYTLKFIKEINRLGKSSYLFRGQKNHEWPLLSTSHRETSTKGGTKKTKAEIINDNLELIN